jgi:hypothetical protein
MVLSLVGCLLLGHSKGLTPSFLHSSLSFSLING